MEYHAGPVHHALQAECPCARDLPHNPFDHALLRKRLRAGLPAQRLGAEPLQDRTHRLEQNRFGVLPANGLNLRPFQHFVDFRNVLEEGHDTLFSRQEISVKALIFGSDLVELIEPTRRRSTELR